MKTRYRLIRRGVRNNAFYCVDTTTGKRTSLRTDSEAEARKIVEAKNQATRQPVLNLQIAKAYLAGSDSGITTRTWQQAVEALTQTKQGANQVRWRTVLKDRALAPLWPRVIIETPGELLLRALQVGTVSTNVYLRRLHNFCVDMNWLPWPLIPKRQWPAVRFKDKRGLTAEEHARIVAREVNLRRGPRQCPPGFAGVRFNALRFACVRRGRARRFHAIRIRANWGEREVFRRFPPCRS